MITNALRNWQDPTDSDFATIGDTIYASNAPWLGSNAGNPSGIIPTTGAAAGPNTVTVTSGGSVFNLIFDAGAPTSFQQGIVQAATILAAKITDHITVNLLIHYSGTGQGA